jgi:predicted phage terminase large subunit-like protein
MAGSPLDYRGPQPNARPQTGLLDWVTEALEPVGLRPARHQKLLLSKLESLSRGDFDRLIVLMPPGSAKSTYASVLFPAWWFLVYPRSSIIAASHTADLAVNFGRQVRSLVGEHEGYLGYRLASDSRGAGRWRTDRGGDYFATGVRGPLVGRRADLLLIDDPIKSNTEAESKWHRDRIWDWYRTDLITRLKPNGRLAVIMTRWHEDDLAGRLLCSRSDNWHLLRLPALAEEGDPLGRKLGEALWPEWEDSNALSRKRAAVGERAWSALFQQRPRPMQGGLFKVANLALVDLGSTELVGEAVRAWDLAATVSDGHNNPDWTVGLKLVARPDGRWIITDVVRLRGTPFEVEQAMVETAERDGDLVRIGIPEDPGQAGKVQAAYLTRRLAGRIVVASRETGSKLTRAAAVSSQVEVGNILMIKAEWNSDFVEELGSFPYGDKDDQVDALCRAFGLLAGAPPATRRVQVSLIGR